MKTIGLGVLVVLVLLAGIYMAVELTFGSPTDDPNFVAKDIIRESEQAQ